MLTLCLLRLLLRQRRLMAKFFLTNTTRVEICSLFLNHQINVYQTCVQLHKSYELIQLKVPSPSSVTTPLPTSLPSFIPTNNPNSITYTSTKLGVSFQYMQLSYANSKPAGHTIEIGNTIYL